jgi:hypothetical protein
MWGAAHWGALYRARAERLRRLAMNAADEDARLILLRAAYDYDLMAQGKEPDEQTWRPETLRVRSRLRQYR